MIRLYQDGKGIKTNPTARGKILGENNPLVIGGNENTASDVATDNYSGRIARVRIYRRALSAVEVALLFRNDR